MRADGRRRRAGSGHRHGRRRRGQPAAADGVGAGGRLRRVLGFQCDRVEGAPPLGTAGGTGAAADGRRGAGGTAATVRAGGGGDVRQRGRRATEAGPEPRLRRCGDGGAVCAEIDGRVPGGGECGWVRSVCGAEAMDATHCRSYQFDNKQIIGVFWYSSIE